MKRFALFAGDRYYPEGGWGDFVDSFNSIKGCTECIHDEEPKPNHPYVTWAHVVDLTGGKVVWSRVEYGGEDFYIVLPPFEEAT